jgi:hypothetical protein
MLYVPSHYQSNPRHRNVLILKLIRSPLLSAPNILERDFGEGGRKKRKYICVKYKNNEILI